MDASVASFVVLLGLLLLGRSLGSAWVVGLITSCAFGSTAIATVTAFGGSSPLLYNVFGLGVITSAVARRTARRDLANAFTRAWIPWVVLGLVVYASGSAIIMPRLFADRTTTFSVGPKGFVEVALSPSPGNLLQTAYLILFALTFVALRMSATRADHSRFMRNGFFAWAIIIAVSGVIDVVAKAAGLGDVLASLRTANYAFLTNDAASGFSRVNGTFSEASAFAGSALGALAFTFAYWRGSGSRGALLLALCLLLLLIMSTSSTAYLGLMFLALPLTISTASSLLRGRDVRQTVIVIMLAVVTVTLTVMLTFVTPGLLDSVHQLMQSTLLDKASSESGLERAYMNQVSIQNFMDTWGMGVGYGSSRSSSWLLATLSQLGVIGTVFQLALLVPLLRGMRNTARWYEMDRHVAPVHDALQSCALALFLGQTISGTNANPGILIFVAIAGVGACRMQAARGLLAANPAWTTPDASASRRLERHATTLNRGLHEQSA